MRIRATVAAVAGALALSALAVPAAQADETEGDTTISNVVVNGGKPVVVGATTTKTITVSFTVKDASGVDWAQAILYHGTNIDSSDSGAVATSSNHRATCTVVSATTSNCKSTFEMEPKYNLVNLSAGMDFGRGFSAVVYVNNLADEKALLSFDRERGGRARLGFQTNQPRTIGVTLRKSF